MNGAISSEFVLVSALQTQPLYIGICVKGSIYIEISGLILKFLNSVNIINYKWPDTEQC